jgi:hypothetical protein
MLTKSATIDQFLFGFQPKVLLCVCLQSSLYCNYYIAALNSNSQNFKQINTMNCKKEKEKRSTQPNGTETPKLLRGLRLCPRCPTVSRIHCSYKRADVPRSAATCIPAYLSIHKLLGFKARLPTQSLFLLCAVGVAWLLLAVAVLSLLHSFSLFGLPRQP